jgi:hypothetical protein
MSIGLGFVEYMASRYPAWSAAVQRDGAEAVTARLQPVRPKAPPKPLKPKRRYDLPRSRIERSFICMDCGCEFLSVASHVKRCLSCRALFRNNKSLR